MPYLEQAIALAVECHFQQVDKNNEPYILHSLRVMDSVRTSLKVRGVNLTSNQAHTIMACAVLHDVVEDTPATVEEISDRFGHTIGSIVDLLTRRERQSYRAYIDRLAVCKDASLIKKADLRDNLDLGRRGSMNESLAVRYAQAWHRLANGEWPCRKGL